jgi:hypothetical protein
MNITDTSFCLAVILTRKKVSMAKMGITIFTECKMAHCTRQPAFTI